MNRGATGPIQDQATQASRPAPPAPSLAQMAELRASGRERKAELLAEAARQFGLLARPSREEINVFKEFFYQMVGGCGKGERRRLSASLASNPYVPRPVVLYLAVEEPEIAAPMLLFSPVLNEVDIIQLARRLSAGHIQILCRRTDLTPAAIVALIAHGGTTAIQLLARNSHSAGSTTLQAARDRLPEPGKDGQAAGPVATAARGTAGTAEDQLLDLAGRGGRLGRAEAPARAVDGSETADGQPFSRGLILAARAGNRRLVAEEIASRCSCPASMIEDLLTERSIETLCVLMKGIGIDDVPANQLILMLRPETGRSREEAARAARLYRRLNSEVCRQFIRSLSGLGGARRASGGGTRAGDAFARAVSERQREIATPAPVGHPARPASQPAPRRFGKASNAA